MKETKLKRSKLVGAGLAVCVAAAASAHLCWDSNNPDVTMSPSSITVGYNETFNVDYKVNTHGNQMGAGHQFTLCYDSDQIDWTDATLNSSVADSGYSITNINDWSGGLPESVGEDMPAGCDKCVLIQVSSSTGNETWSSSSSVDFVDIEWKSLTTEGTSKVRYFTASCQHYHFATPCLVPVCPGAIDFGAEASITVFEF